MIKEIVTDTPNWDKEITLKLTLKELQIIFDAVGELSPKVMYEKHDENSPFYDAIPKNDITLIKLIDDVYNDLEIIVDKYNGVLDD